MVCKSVKSHCQWQRGEFWYVPCAGTPLAGSDRQRWAATVRNDSWKTEGWGKGRMVAVAKVSSEQQAARSERKEEGAGQNTQIERRMEANCRKIGQVLFLFLSPGGRFLSKVIDTSNEIE